MTELEKAADTYSQLTCNQSVEFAFKAGAKWAFQNRDKEHILIAACSFLLEGMPHRVVTTGFRHDSAVSAGDFYFAHVFDMIHETPKAYAEKFERFRDSEIQGFLTSKGRFVDRKEAAKIAFSAGQISDQKEELYSEDLY